MIRFPVAYEGEYLKIARQIMAGIIDYTNNYAEEIAQAYSVHYRSDAINDPQLPEFLHDIRVEADRRLNREDVEEAVTPIITGTTQAVNRQFNMEVKSIAGIEAFVPDEKIQEFVEEKITENVDLIRTLPERHFEQIETTVEKAINQGWTPQRLEKSIPQAGSTSRFNAERIARDQIGKVQGQVIHERHDNLGLQNFIWSTSEDERVRGQGEHDQFDHAALHGRKFSWKEGAPPFGEPVDDGPTLTGELTMSGFPGEDIQCRCTAQVVESELIAVVGNQN